MRLTDRGVSVLLAAVIMGGVLLGTLLNHVLDTGCWDGWEWAPDCAAVAAEHGGGGHV